MRIRLGALIFTILMIIAVPVMAGDSLSSNTASTAVGVGVGGGATLNMQQSSMPAESGMGRLFPFPQTLPQTPMIPYLGPFDGKSWNILPDLNLLPDNITKEQAIEMTKKKGLSEVRQLNKVPWVTEKIIIVRNVPKQYRILGYVFQTAYGTTIDAVADAALEAMKLGGDGIIVVNRTVEYNPSSYTIGLGSSATGAALDGAKESNLGGTAGASIGFAYSKAKKNATEGLVWIVVDWK